MDTRGIRIQFLARARDVALLHSIQTSSETSQVSHPMATGGALSPGIKWPGCEANHSSPSVAKVNNMSSYISILQCAFMAWHLIKYRGNFTYILKQKKLADVLFTVRKLNIPGI
jgi:hypothetical protein